jgi:hypothetical protein
MNVQLVAQWNRHGLSAVLAHVLDLPDLLIEIIGHRNLLLCARGGEQESEGKKNAIFLSKACGGHGCNLQQTPYQAIQAGFRGCTGVSVDSRLR